MKKILKNTKIVTPEAVKENHWLLIEDDKIADLGYMNEKIPLGDIEIDLEGMMVLPGLIDIHSDMIESLLQPRSTALMDFGMSLAEAEKQLAACGITTMFHSISMYQEGTWDVKEIRQAPQVKKLADLIKKIKKTDHLINHKYHLRYEIDNLACYEEVRRMIKNDQVQLLSFMDHTPKQGQYQDLSIYRRHLPGEGKELTNEEFSNLVERELHKPKVSNEELKVLADLARERNISIASHDDDTVEKLMQNLTLGIKISEFPITLTVAQKAVNLGLKTVLGAPNVLLGKSHSGNLVAAEAVKAGCGSILCSDYYPQALLRAVFKLSHEFHLPLPKACRLATLSPAEATGIDGEYGSLTPGKKADLIVVRQDVAGQPQLLSTWVDGICILDMTYHKAKEA